eukprot:2621756-Rhodomonas_salina.1
MTLRSRDRLSLFAKLTDSRAACPGQCGSCQADQPRWGWISTYYQGNKSSVLLLRVSKQAPGRVEMLSFKLPETYRSTLNSRNLRGRIPQRDARSGLG